MRRVKGRRKRFARRVHTNVRDAMGSPRRYALVDSDNGDRPVKPGRFGVGACERGCVTSREREREGGEAGRFCKISSRHARTKRTCLRYLAGVSIRLTRPVMRFWPLLPPPTSDSVTWNAALNEKHLGALETFATLVEEDYSEYLVRVRISNVSRII